MVSRAGEMAQWVKCVAHRHEDLGSDLQHSCKGYKAAPICNSELGVWEAESGPVVLLAGHSGQVVSSRFSKEPCLKQSNGGNTAPSLYTSSIPHHQLIP